MKEKIYLSPPDLRGNEQALLTTVFKSNWIAPQGPMLSNFEDRIKQLTNTKYALALNSATSAIHLGLQVLGVEKGDKVLCPTFTFVASVNPISYIGAIPILLDAETATWNLCPILLEKAIIAETTKGKKPKVLILVQGYGTPAEIEAVLEIAKKYKILVLEDAASALGATHNSQHCGTFGDVGIFSFNGNKIITTSGGGMLITNHQMYYKRASYLASQAKESTPDYQHNAIGYNYRLSNVLAALGVAQLELLADFLKARKFNYEFYKSQLQSNSVVFLSSSGVSKSNYWLTCVLFASNKIREKVRLALVAENIESRPLWKPMHLQSIYNNVPYYSNGVSEELYKRGLCLPSGSSLFQKDLERVCRVIKKCL